MKRRGSPASSVIPPGPNKPSPQDLPVDDPADDDAADDDPADDDADDGAGADDSAVDCVSPTPVAG
jgi:hypothetical protein